MNHETEVMICWSLYDCAEGERARDLEKKNAPRLDLVQEKEWVPQTMADQVWAYYRFANETDKDDFLRALSPKAQKWVRPMWDKPFGSAG